MAARHKVFISYHHENDQNYKNIFELRFGNSADILVSRSVGLGDINPNLQTDTVRGIIRDEYLADSTVTVVLVGVDTWRRKHVDWEIASSIRDTRNNPRSGLIGILLPSYPAPAPGQYERHTVPPRLHDNVACGFATMHVWSNDVGDIERWIHAAFLRRNTILPDNSFPSFVNNRGGDCWYR